MTSTPRIVSSSEISATEAKLISTIIVNASFKAQKLPRWITLKKITYLDANGKERLWEYAERKTRKSIGIDGVAVLAILTSRTNAFPVSTVVIEQYRPPIDKVIVELPAGKTYTVQTKVLFIPSFEGLIDEGETPEQAAIRELEEETGYKADDVIESTPVIVTDPGMTNANMKLIVVHVVLPDQMEYPLQKLDAGEFISTRVVELAKLDTELKEYAKNGFVVDARLSHFASGYNLASRIK